MKSIAAVLLGLAWCACAQAEVYKWTDERGEVHYGPTAPPGVAAEQVLTQEQIDKDNQAAPPAQPPAGDDDGIHAAVQERQEQCQRYRALREEFLKYAAANPTGPDWTPLAGYGMGYLMRDDEQNTNRVMDYGEIEANIRKYCD